MMNRQRLIACLLLALVLPLAGCQNGPAPTTHVSAEEKSPNDQMAELSKKTRPAAVALLKSLSDEQREKIARPISDPLRKDWHFIPRDREGLKLGELDADQKKLVHALLQTALSDAGYLKATQIMWLETLLAEMEKKPEYRDAGKYAIVIFGDPADEKSAWGWRFEGHHLSLNMTYTADGVGVTPMFFGSNPAVVPVGPLAGMRVIGDAHNLAVELAQSMSDEQLKKMMLAEKPKDVINSPEHVGSLANPVGVNIGELDKEQKDMLFNLFDSYAFLVETRHAEQLHQFFWKWGGEATNVLRTDIYFSWAGPVDSDKPFYYRIHSPRFVIEYSCQGKNHVHTVVHDLTDPLQEDLLKKHFEQHAH